MRLVRIGEDGSLTLTEYLNDHAPQYAILSHTWLSDDEELTFADMVSESGRDKQGYAKLKFCANQARKDNLSFFWMDTCCIDKTNNVELSEAIVSMFAWYREAVKCYVYLSDVPLDSSQAFDTTWETSFRKSRWFTRGWTLQELLAPRWVEFFSEEALMLGDRNSLESLLSEITQIPVRALRGRPLTEFDMRERLEWGAHRETKREEDRVYCLYGIFDIAIYIQYGEGYNRAMRRLHEEIQKLSTRNTPWKTELLVQNAKMPAPSELPAKKQKEIPSSIDETDNNIEKLQHALQRSQLDKGPNHPQTLAISERLGTAFEECGDYEQAAIEFRRALKGREVRKQHEHAQNDLLRLACCSSALIKNDTVSPAMAKRVSDHYVYTRPMGLYRAKYKHFHEIAPIGFRVKALRVWFNKFGLCGVQMDYSDGSRSTLKGVMSSQGNDHEFQAGETVSEVNALVDENALRIEVFAMETVRYEETGNAISTQVSWGQKDKGVISYRRAETGTGILVGLCGKHSISIHQLGLVFLSPTHTLARKSVFDITREENQSQRYCVYDDTHRRDLFFTEGAGGFGGKPFQDVAEGSVAVQKISVWKMPGLHSQLGGIQLTFIDGTISTARGHTEGECITFEFQPSELITELAVAWGYSKSRIHPWCFKFETSESRSFKVAKCPECGHKPLNYYQQDLKPEGVLVGIHGYCEDELDWLGFIFR